MENFLTPIQIRWADIDANRHLRHSIYYDYGASARMQLLESLGLTMQKMEEAAIGPVLFREEAVFKREIKFEDRITLSVELLKASRDYSRWSICHDLVKSDGTVAAVITVDGAWIDLNKRKLAIPNEFIFSIFEQLPKSPQFQFTG